MSVYINDLLDPDIEAGARARIRYANDIVETDGGYEIRNARWAYPLHSFEFNLSPGARGDDLALQAFIDLYHAAGGSHATFRFHWWRDDPVVDQYIATGDGSTTLFQLFVTYERGGVTRYRKITRPVSGTLTVYANGIPVAVGVDYETGIISFGVAPTAGARLTADFEYDVPVRFADDELEILGIAKDLDQPVSVILNEVREAGLDA